MPRRSDLHSILILGSGPIVIGQACEFDYSGSQGAKALRQEGYRVILVNSNPATIMTDPELADRTYIEPLTVPVVTRILERERPDAVLPTLGGQTALNLAMALGREGVLARLGIELIGASLEAIDKAEDREKFKAAMERIGLRVPRSGLVRSLSEAIAIQREIGFPTILRPSFTLGGTGSSIAYNAAEFAERVEWALGQSPVGTVLIEESVLGWKEFELEVMRDRKDNVVVVCSIENFDPMGVHTGDSITVAPAMTLTDKEYQRMRTAAAAVIREIGVETGGANIQFAINPRNGQMVVVEMNPRVSRSSALASKATGFPIAKIAAKLAVGYTLDELPNDITTRPEARRGSSEGSTDPWQPACFEPTLDYVVVKIPRFAFEKFPGADATLTTQMKSVGEVMAIGRTFKQALHKAIRSLETGSFGFDQPSPLVQSEEALGPRVVLDELRRSLATPLGDRLWRIAEALRAGLSVQEVADVTGIDPWFLHQIREIVELEEQTRRLGAAALEPTHLAQLKEAGLSDRRIAALGGVSPEVVAARRREAGLRPTYSRVDTCAAEFVAHTPYLYSSYDPPWSGPALVRPGEADPGARRKVVILGGGPNRIGQGIEFDYCCVHAVQALKALGFETIMINCNPETVSTDYDTADRLYFEPLTLEDVLAVIEAESERGTVEGVLVQFGGQTPLRLALGLEAAGVRLLGTPADAIDRAEDRQRFAEVLQRLGLRAPESGTARTVQEALEVAARVGYPCMVRPSYVLGGRAMELVRDPAQLSDYVHRAILVSSSDLRDHPILIDHFLSDAVEVDVDAVADGKEVVIAGVMEHIEEAGIHSGDSACVLPPNSLPHAVVERIRRQTRALALELGVVGLINVQFAVKDGEVYVLEVNPRASRTVPFVSKATGVPWARVAAQVMAGRTLRDLGVREVVPEHVSVKEAVFPFSKFPGVDTVLGPEMRSTGEVMGIDRNFALAFAKSQIAAGNHLPTAAQAAGKWALFSVCDRDKPGAAEVARMLHDLGFALLGTRGTAAFLSERGLPARSINRVKDGRPHVVDAMINGEVALMVNTSDELTVRDSVSLRRTALLRNIPYFTTIAAARAAAQAIAALQAGPLAVRSLQEYMAGQQSA
ncbi:MAG: carbamoyl-phosphate synthase large subunit [Myxococcales bacterium]|nr:carbamoyl-phosphate synthase large subunit [Myxococcota bacterium]MDW8281921.1 carbamoyl-phosphate synthase large subunit [Myxococcales bacterium]